MTWDDRDRNGRIIGWVMVDGGIWVNKVMVLKGYAWWFERYAPDEIQLREAQETTREAKRGLWAEPMAAAPRERGRFTIINHEVNIYSPVISFGTDASSFNEAGSR